MSDQLVKEYDINFRINTLKEKCEVMSILCQKGTNYWNIIKYSFQIPLILISSVMCILNSLDNEETNMKTPNIIINSVNVLLLWLQNSLKISEKVELFKNLSNNFLKLAHELDEIKYQDEVIDSNRMLNYIDKYDSYLFQCQFENIPRKIKLQVIDTCQGYALPLQLNGGSGLIKQKDISNRSKVELVSLP